MEKLTWKNVNIKLGALKPWEQNPKRIGKAQAQRLLDSFKEFGQPETIAIGPEGEVYDGHQRLSVLLSAYGPDYEIAARQSNRPLTDQERRKLVVFLHSGTTGTWDWDTLSGWDTEELKGWGLDQGALMQWNDDAANLREMLNAGYEVNPEEEWEGMPEYEQEDADEYKALIIHLETFEDAQALATLIGQEITDTTRFLWFPKKENIDGVNYVCEDGDEP